MRRIAPQLAEVFARHGHSASVEATITGRTRTSYRVPLLLHTSVGPVLVDGDLDNATVDDGAVLRLYLMALDCGAQALFLHSGEPTAAARDSCGERVTLWPRPDAIALLGGTLWNAALELPLPALPGPLAAATPATTPPAFPVQVHAEPVQAVFAQETDFPPETEPTAAPVEPTADSVEPTPDAAQATHTPIEATLHPGEPMAEPVPPAPPLRDVMPTPEQASPSEPFIDLEDPAGDGAAMDLETGVDVVVTTLPTSEEDELSTAQPLTAPTRMAETSPPSLPEAPHAPDADAPLFEMPPAFRDQAPPLPVPEGSKGLLPALVTLDEAKAAVADRLFGIEEWELILQPVHLFDYTVELLRSGSLQADLLAGRIQVNGTDRTVTVTDPATADPARPSRVLATPDLTVMDKVLRVNPERAEELAHEWATATHGKTVHVSMASADDSFDLTERQTIGPTSSQVKLGHLGVWHRPFWRLWGTNGHVDLDAVEGHVLDEELKTANADFLLVD